MKIILLVAAVLLISGCGKGSTEIIDPGKIIYSGEEGVNIEFAQNAPPEKWPANAEFPVLVKITNKGALGVDGDNYWLVITAEKPKLTLVDGTGSLGPISGNDIGGLVDDVLAGRDTDYAGGLQTHEIALRANTNPLTENIEAPESFNGVITATICYDYVTKFSGGICIDAEQYSLSITPKACEMEPMSFIDQGAPIAITRIEPIVIKSNGASVLQFKIYFANLGKGSTVDHDRTADACSGVTGAAAKDLYGVVSISGQFGNIALTCNSDTRTISDNPEHNYFICKITPTSATPLQFTQDLSITLSYGYTETISRIIEIEEQAT